MKLLMTAEETAEALGLGRTVIYDLMRSGELESLKIGRSRRIPTAAIEDYVARLREQQ